MGLCPCEHGHLPQQATLLGTECSLIGYSHCPLYHAVPIGTMSHRDVYNTITQVCVLVWQLSGCVANSALSGPPPPPLADQLAPQTSASQQLMAVRSKVTEACGTEDSIQITLYGRSSLQGTHLEDSVCLRLSSFSPSCILSSFSYSIPGSKRSSKLTRSSQPSTQLATFLRPCPCQHLVLIDLTLCESDEHLRHFIADFFPLVKYLKLSPKVSQPTHTYANLETLLPALELIKIQKKRTDCKVVL